MLASRSLLLIWFKPQSHLQATCCHWQQKQHYKHLSSSASVTPTTRGSVAIYEDDQHVLRAEQLPLAVWKTMQQIRAAGHTVLLVGGAIRDLLLGVTPKDFDLLTSAHLAEVKQVVHRSSTFGRHFPICRVDVDGVRIEVSSMHTRVATAYTTRGTHTPGAAGGGAAAGVPPDAAQILQAGGPEAAAAAATAAALGGHRAQQIGRHRRSKPPHARQQQHQQHQQSAGGSLPTHRLQQQQEQPQQQPQQLQQLSWAAARRENALGRDFTVNCLMYDPFAGLLFDYAAGCADVQARVLRCNGDVSRFSRDPPCMLRAVRCAARAGLTIEPATLAALQQHGHLLSSHVNKQRLTAELLGCLSYGAAATSMQLLVQTQLLQHVLPHTAAYMIKQQDATDSSSSSRSSSESSHASVAASSSLSAAAASQQPLQHPSGVSSSSSSRQDAQSALGHLWSQLKATTQQQQQQEMVQTLPHQQQQQQQNHHHQEQQQQQLTNNLLLRVLAALDQHVSVLQPAPAEVVLACLTAPLLADLLSDAVVQLQQVAHQQQLKQQKGARQAQQTLQQQQQQQPAAGAGVAVQNGQGHHQQQQQGLLCSEDLQDLHQQLPQHAAAVGISLLWARQAAVARPFSSSSSSSSSSSGAVDGSNGAEAGLPADAQQHSSVRSPGDALSGAALVQQLLRGVPLEQCIHDAACSIATLVCCSSSSSLHAAEGAVEQQAPMPAHLQLFGAHTPRLVADLFTAHLQLSKQQHLVELRSGQEAAAHAPSAQTPQQQEDQGVVSSSSRASSSRQPQQQAKRSSVYVDLWDDYAAALPRSNKQFRQLMQRQWGKQVHEAGFVGSIAPAAVLLAAAGDSDNDVDDGDHAAPEEGDETSPADTNRLLHRVLKTAGLNLLHCEQQLSGLAAARCKH